MDRKDEFYTLKGYQLLEDAEFTPALEDYLEMICRISETRGQVRIRELSEHLNVRPSSASKMVRQLNGMGYLRAEKYGAISLTDKGLAAGRYLLYRHYTVHRFLCLLNRSENELEETEKIEHFLSRRTVRNLERLIKQMTKGANP